VSSSFGSEARVLLRARLRGPELTDGSRPTTNVWFRQLILTSSVARREKYRLLGSDVGTLDRRDKNREGRDSHRHAEGKLVGSSRSMSGSKSKSKTVRSGGNRRNPRTKKLGVCKVVQRRDGNHRCALPPPQPKLSSLHPRPLPPA